MQYKLKYCRSSMWFTCISNKTKKKMRAWSHISKKKKSNKMAGDGVMKMGDYGTIRMYSICVHVLYAAHRDVPMCYSRKGEYSSRSWKGADIRGLRRLQHLEAILLLCCGQVRCTELNSTTTMAKRAAETKEGYPCFLNPFTTGRSVAWGTERTTAGHRRRSRGNYK